MKESQRKEKYSIASVEAPEDDLRLKQFVEGYKNNYEQPDKWSVPIIITSLIIGLILARNIALNDNITLNIILLTLDFILLFAGVFYWFINLEASQAQRRPRTVVFIYTGGFIWRTEQHDGTILQQETVYFDEAENIVTCNRFYHTPSAGNHSHGHTSLHIQILDNYNKTLFLKDDIRTFDHASRFAVCAIEQSWSKIVRTRKQQEFVEKGFVTFGNIVIGRNRFTVNGQDYLNGVSRYCINNDYITFYPIEPKLSPYYRKIGNPTGAYAISIVELPNKQVFIEYFNDFFRGQLG